MTVSLRPAFLAVALLMGAVPAFATTPAASGSTPAPRPAVTQGVPAATPGGSANVTPGGSANVTPGGSANVTPGGSAAGAPAQVQRPATQGASAVTPAPASQAPTRTN